MVDEVWPGGVDPGDTEQELEGGIVQDGSDGERPKFALAALPFFCPSVDLNLPAGFHPGAGRIEREDLGETVGLVRCRRRLAGHDDLQGGRVRYDVSKPREVYPAPRLVDPPGHRVSIPALLSEPLEGPLTWEGAFHSLFYERPILGQFRPRSFGAVPCGYSLPHPSRPLAVRSGEDQILCWHESCQ